MVAIISILEELRSLAVHVELCGSAGTKDAFKIIENLLRNKSSYLREDYVRFPMGGDVLASKEPHYCR
jgi:hypothetical protein